MANILKENYKVSVCIGLYVYVCVCVCVCVCIIDVWYFLPLAGIPVINF